MIASDMCPRFQRSVSLTFRVVYLPPTIVLYTCYLALKPSYFFFVDGTVTYCNFLA